MNGWIKYGVIGLVAVIFLMFNSWKYWDRQDKQDRMRLEELKHEAVNDSLKAVNMHLQWEVEQWHKIDSLTYREEQRQTVHINRKSEEARSLPASKQFEILRELIKK